MNNLEFTSDNKVKLNYNLPFTVALFLYDVQTAKLTDALSQTSKTTSTATFNSDVVVYLSNAEDINTFTPPRSLVFLSLAARRIGYLKKQNNTYYPLANMSIDGKSAHILKINNKEVKKIVRNSDNKVLYESYPLGA